MNVYQAISKVTAEMAIGIEKTKKNTQQNYMFRGIEDVYKVLNPALTNAGLVILPKVKSRETEVFSGKNGGNLFYTRIIVDFDFVSAKDGSSHTITTVGEAMDSGDKGHNKAMSAAYKYAAFMTFCIPTEGILIDSENDSHEVLQNPSSERQATAQNNQSLNKTDEEMAVINEIGHYLSVFNLSADDFKNITGNPTVRNASLTENKSALDKLKSYAEKIESYQKELGGIPYGS